MKPKFVLVESPYALQDGNTENYSYEQHFKGSSQTHIDYARKCLRDCLDRGEIPIASHLLYTQTGILDDTIAEEREQGINAGLAWSEKVDKVVVYIDLGISSGMQRGIDYHTLKGVPIEYRRLPADGEQCIKNSVNHVKEVVDTFLGKTAMEKYKIIRDLGYYKEEYMSINPEFDGVYRDFFIELIKKDGISRLYNYLFRKEK